MGNRSLLKKERLNFDNLIKEKEIDSESKLIKYFKNKKKVFISLGLSFFILIMAILNINGLAGHTSGVSLNHDSFDKKYEAVIGENKTKLKLNDNGKVQVISSEYKDKINNVESWENIISVDCGYNYAVGLTGDGRVKSCGNNDYGQCNTEDWENIVKVLTGNSKDSMCTIGLKNDGTVFACGDNKNGQCDVDKLNDVIDISIGEKHTAVLRSDGTVAACGNNDYGQCDVSSWKDIKSITANLYYTEGIKSNGEIVTAGKR